MTASTPNAPAPSARRAAERESLFLARLALLLFEQVGDEARCREALAQAIDGLPTPSLSAWASAQPLHSKTYKPGDLSMDRRTLLTTLAATAAAAAAPWARAQGAFPDQLIKWVVPYLAGGGTDVIARTLSEAMRQTLGQQIVIDNRPGASTNIGAELVAKAKPDGYTIMLGRQRACWPSTSTCSASCPSIPRRTSAYIGAIGKFPLALVVHPDFPAQDFKAFLAYVKANPGKVNYASPGNGSPHHLAMEMFKVRTGTFITHIPYRGAAPAMADVMGGAGALRCSSTWPRACRSCRARRCGCWPSARAAARSCCPTCRRWPKSASPNSEVFAFQGILGPGRACRRRWSRG